MFIIDLLPAIIIPTLILLLPGVILLRNPVHSFRHSLNTLALILIISTVFHLLATVTLAALHLPVALSLIFSLLISIGYFPRVKPNIIPFLKQLHPLPSILLVFFLALSLLFVFFHQGLPTGDIQKAIFWAGTILDQGGFPPYNISIALFNRDPVDFYTPSLHSYTAQVISLSPQPFLTLGFLVIMAGLAIASIGAAIAVNIAKTDLVLAASLTVIFILTQLRFLRYLKEPGYHYQNLFGELLFFSIFFIILLIINRARPAYFLLIFFTVASLVLTHQFTSFLTILVILPPAIITFWYYREIFIVASRRHSKLVIVALLALAIFAFMLLKLNLQQKLWHFFTATPHLLLLTPNLTAYPKLMGTGWMLGSIIALLFLFSNLSNSPRKIKTKLMSFISFTVAILLMSQAPRFHLDIPPVRALYYSVLPLSIALAIFFSRLIKTLPASHPNNKRLIKTILILFAAMIAWSGVSQVGNLSPDVRTNSTLRADYLPAIKQLTGTPDSSVILVDDFMRRSASWLLLTGRPVYSRLSSDLKRVMDESTQSPVRNQLYLTQLDYEKIFLFGNHPLSSILFDKHKIEYLATDNSTAAYLVAHPTLETIYSANDLTIFRYSRPDNPNVQTFEETWLLNASTLLNNLGDPDDTARHNPASLPATRLSPLTANPPPAYRETTTPLIPLTFNPASFVTALWDQDHSGYSDSSLLIHLEIDSIGPLELITPAHTTYPLKSGTNRLVIDARDVPLHANNLVTFLIANNQSASVKINLIALGLSPIP